MLPRVFVNIKWIYLPDLVKHLLIASPMASPWLILVGKLLPIAIKACISKISTDIVSCLTSDFASKLLTQKYGIPHK